MFDDLPIDDTDDVDHLDGHLARSRRPARRVAPGTPRQPRIPPERWPLVAADARLLGLRQAAKQHGVSHETVRRIVRRVGGNAINVSAD